MTLKELQIGKSAIVDAVGGAGALRQHFLDMGLIPGAEVTLVKLAPMGDPMELRIHGYELTLRLDDAAQITVTPTEKTPAVHAPVAEKMVEHPGLGEGGKYHTKEGEHPLPEDKTLTFALAGNQNCGKTTLFNQLTGSNQHVGNFPGVTVDRKSGAIKGHPETEVTDLPGIYSMSPYSSEEIVTRQFIIGEKPTGIINIVDATNIERNLYLTMQLMELDIPMVLALNMMDEMRGNGGTVRINKMEAMLGIPVIPISAAKNEGVDELVDHAVHVAKYQERPGRMDFCSEDDHGGAVHRCIHGILHLIEDHAKAAGIPVRFAATKLVEGDPRIEEALKLDPNEKEMIEHIIVQMEQERGLDRAAAIADMRFHFIHQLVEQTVVKPRQSKEQLRSNRIDRILTGKYTAIPAFVGIMALVFYLWYEAPEDEKNFPMIMEMLRAGEVREDDDSYQSPLDELFDRLEMRSPDHIAVKYYKDYRSGSAKTLKSIQITLASRLEKFNLSSVAALTATDELDLSSLGEKKVALFALIPDNDASFNFLVSLLYASTFQELFYSADRVHGGSLPVPVHFLMDEFANVSLPDDFDKLLATMRSRNISVSIIIQNIAQLKALFEKQWESIIGNCDEFLYLGGNETSTHKLISENYLGKSTLWLDTYGKSTGHSGSYSTNNQITGRELMTPDEVRMLDNNLALLFIRGEAPLMDEKYDLLKHPNIKYTTDGGAPVYSHGGTENAVADMTIGRLTPGDLANIQEPETLYELLSDEDMENIFQFKEDTKNETVS